MVRGQVLPVPRLSSWAAYHYPKTIRVRVAMTIVPDDDFGTYPIELPKLGNTEFNRLRHYAEQDAHRVRSLGAQGLQDLEPIDLATEMMTVKVAIRWTPQSVYEAEYPWERRERLRLLNYETDPTLPSGALYWEPVATIWINPYEVESSLTHPEMLDAEIALLKRYVPALQARLPLLTNITKNC